MVAKPADPIEPCEHFDTIRPIAPGTDGCVDCMAIGAPWRELRVCMTCGHVGCCEDSEYRHALRHYEATGHPMLCSYDRSETWGWCYVDRRYFDPMPGPLPQRPTLLGRLWKRVADR